MRASKRHLPDVACFYSWNLAATNMPWKQRTSSIFFCILWRVGCLPPNYQHLPVPYSPPFTRLPTGVGVWERRGAETARSGGVWWGTHLKWMEPHHRRCYMPSAPLLWRPVSSPCMHAGVLVGPGRERWVWRTAPARRLTGQDAGPYPWKRRGPKGGRSRW